MTRHRAPAPGGTSAPGTPAGRVEFRHSDDRNRLAGLGWRPQRVAREEAR